MLAQMHRPCWGCTCASRPLASATLPRGPPMRALHHIPARWVLAAGGRQECSMPGSAVFLLRRLQGAAAPCPAQPLAVLYAEPGTVSRPAAVDGGAAAGRCRPSWPGRRRRRRSKPEAVHMVGEGRRTACRPSDSARPEFRCKPLPASSPQMPRHAAPQAPHFGRSCRDNRGPRCQSRKRRRSSCSSACAASPPCVLRPHPHSGPLRSNSSCCCCRRAVVPVSVSAWSRCVMEVCAQGRSGRLRRLEMQ